VLLMTPGAPGQVVIDGIQFADQGAAGVIDLGYQRGGIAVLDCNGDGYPDFVTGDRPGELIRLYLNVPDPIRPGNRTFVDATAGSGLDDADGLARVSRGVVAADYDNDGHVDVYLAGYRPADQSFGLLYRGHGDGTFTNVSLSSGVRGAGCNADSTSWTDYDLDGDLDLIVGCRTDGLNFEFIENDGDGTFTFAPDRLPPPVSSNGAYSMTWLDVSGDGYDDCLTLASPGETVLLLNSPGPSGGREFVNAAAAYGFTSLGPAPMGIAAGDYDGDGDLDVAVSNGTDGSYYRFDEGLLTAVDLLSSILAWGVTWIDVENDSDLDLYMCGSVGQGANFDKLFRNNGLEGFDEISTALNGIFTESRYAVQVDFNNDGRQDIITCNTGSADESLSIFENLTKTSHHWIKLRLVGDGAAVNRDAVGAVVRLHAGGTVLTRHLASGSSTSATEDARLHFGLGPATSVDEIEVVWPRAGSLASRTEVFCGPFAADQIVTLTASEPTVPGDVDGDGTVGITDFLALLAAWGACPGPPADCPGDLDGDCMVGITDFLDLLANWG
jgi:hypothetical protein